MATATAYLLFSISSITGHFSASCDGSLYYALFAESYKYETEKIMQIDSTSGDITAVYNTTLNTTEYAGFLGSAVHPITGQVYVVVLNARGYSDGGHPRALARISIPEGTVEIIGSLGTGSDYLGIADLAFGCDGTLYAISGDRRAVGQISEHYLNKSSAIYIVDANTANTQFITSRHNASLNINGSTAKVHAGEVIAFNFDDGRIYRLSGKVGGHLFEAISIDRDLSDDSYLVEVTNIGIVEGNDLILDIKQIMALEYIGGDIFVGFGVDRKLFSMTVDGHILDGKELGSNFEFIGNFLRYNIPRAIIVTDGVENDICYRLCTDAALMICSKIAMVMICSLILLIF